jgi:hypothetical protein
VIKFSFRIVEGNLQKRPPSGQEERGRIADHSHSLAQVVSIKTGSKPDMVVAHL